MSGNLAFPVEFDTRINECVVNALHSIREYLGMDVGFISEFKGDHRVMLVVDADRPVGIFTGQRIPMSAGYCRDVVEGKLPEGIPDTSILPRAAAKPETKSLPIGSHASVPIRLSDGRVFGTFCCFDAKPTKRLSQRDISAMKTIADVVAFHIEHEVMDAVEKDKAAERLRSVLDAGLPIVVYQPVMEIASGRIVGAEALARFPWKPTRAPDQWFSEARSVSMGDELSEAAVKRALDDFAPARSGTDMVLGLNMPPSFILSVDLEKLLEGYPLDRLTIEITEHDRIDDYDAVAVALSSLRAKGVRLAIDDMGAGFANMRHVVKLKPDAIKIDASLIGGVDADPMKQAWISGLVEFARKAGISLLAEGIETRAELDLMREMGVRYGQGYFLGRPMNVDKLVDEWSE